jgi:hypothetical protein
MSLGVEKADPSEDAKFTAHHRAEVEQAESLCFCAERVLGIHSVFA